MESPGYEKDFCCFGVIESCLSSLEFVENVLLRNIDILFPHPLPYSGGRGGTGSIARITG